jgi:hypothetical protein
MVKSAVWRLVLLLCCLFGVMVVGDALSSKPTPAMAATAAPGSVVISLPGGNNNGQVGGPVGTQVHVAGTNFGSLVTINLYTTTNNDPAQCRKGNPNSHGLTPFTPPTVMTQQDGTFAVDTSWPANANAVGAAYYICAVPDNALLLGTLSSNNFTVSPTPTISVSPTTVMTGGQITVSGLNWLPPQAVTISLINDAQTTPILNTNATSDQNGNFTVTITIPANAPGGTYTISVTSDQSPNVKAVANGILTVTSNVTPTPTVSPTATATAAPSPTTTPTTTPTTSSNGGNNGSTPPSAGSPSGSLNFLLITMAGLGVLLVIVGVFLFVMYSRQQ